MYPAVREAHQALRGIEVQIKHIIALTDGIDFQGDVLMSRAEVLRLSGRDADAVPVVRDALACYERKENVMSAARARAALQEWGEAIG